MGAVALLAGCLPVRGFSVPEFSQKYKKAVRTRFYYVRTFPLTLYEQWCYMYAQRGYWDMKDDRLYVRLSREDKERLKVLAGPYGGVGGWVLAKMGDSVVEKPVIKTKVDAVRAVKTLPVSSGRATHSPTCGCLMCKPPKGS